LLKIANSRSAVGDAASNRFELRRDFFVANPRAAVIAGGAPRSERTPGVARDTGAKHPTP